MRVVLVVFLPLFAFSAWERTHIAIPDENLTGAALTRSGQFVTWGDPLRVWNTAHLTSKVLVRGPFGQGGCLAGNDVIVVRGRGPGDLVSIRLRDGRVETIDTEVEMPDCIATTLFGRTGVLIIQRGMQVRFYYRSGAGKWQSRDIYSIYTPSYQTGLALADVNNDGRTDIFCGNYWIESPRRWEESWRLFAINTWFEDPRSASLRIAVLSPRSIVAAQSEGARFTRMDAPADPKLQWKQTALAPKQEVRNVRSLVVWNGQVLIGESAGRLLLLRPASEVAEEFETGCAIVAILPSGANSFLALSSDGVTSWTQRPRRR